MTCSDCKYLSEKYIVLDGTKEYQCDSEISPTGKRYYVNPIYAHPCEMFEPKEDCSESVSK